MIDQRLKRKRVYLTVPWSIAARERAKRARSDSDPAPNRTSEEEVDIADGELINFLKVRFFKLYFLIVTCGINAYLSL